MGLVVNEVQHHDLEIKISVVQRVRGEVRDPWRCIAVDFDHFERLTPVELRQLGRWFIEEGKRIGREYKSNGALRDTA